MLSMSRYMKLLAGQESPQARQVKDKAEEKDDTKVDGALKHEKESQLKGTLEMVLFFRFWGFPVLPFFGYIINEF